MQAFQISVGWLVSIGFTVCGDCLNLECHCLILWSNFVWWRASGHGSFASYHENRIGKVKEHTFRTKLWFICMWYMCLTALDVVAFIVVFFFSLNIVQSFFFEQQHHSELCGYHCLIG